ncbi:MAG TPA: hypothetical protein VK163_01295 [Opitutaceae bacterium]|nr:hypothetical protein [Opitutaceae bacterium]
METQHAPESAGRPSRTRSPRTVAFTVRVSPSTARWLRALARAGKPRWEKGKRADPCTVAELLEQAADCMADCAGRRPGSWEADVARSLLESSGLPTCALFADYSRCCRADEADNAKWRAALAAEKGVAP